MIDDFSEIVVPTIVTVIVAVILVFLIATIVTIPFNLQECALYDGTDVPHKWLLFGGCKVQLDNDLWVSVDDYFVLEQLGGSK